MDFTYDFNMTEQRRINQKICILNNQYFENFPGINEE